MGRGGCLDRTQGLWQRECWRQLHYYQLASPTDNTGYTGGKRKLNWAPTPPLLVARDACWLGRQVSGARYPQYLEAMCLSQPRAITDNIGGETTEKPTDFVWKFGKVEFYNFTSSEWDEWLLVVVVSGAWHQWCPDSRSRPLIGQQLPHTGLWFVSSVH